MYASVRVYSIPRKHSSLLHHTTADLYFTTSHHTIWNKTISNYTTTSYNSISNHHTTPCHTTPLPPSTPYEPYYSISYTTSLYSIHQTILHHITPLQYFTVLCTMLPKVAGGWVNTSPTFTSRPATLLAVSLWKVRFPRVKFYNS